MPAVGSRGVLLLVSVLLPELCRPLFAQDVTRRDSPRQFIIAISDSAIGELAAADARIASLGDRRSLRRFAVELMDNLCQLHTGGDAEHPGREIRGDLWTGETADSSRLMLFGAPCLRRRGSGELRGARILVLAARVEVSSTGSMTRLSMRVSTQLLDIALQGESAAWSWTPTAGWQLIAYSRRDMDELPSHPQPPASRPP